MTYAGEVNLDADLVRLWRGNLDVFDGQVLGSLPGDGGLRACVNERTLLLLEGDVTSSCRSFSRGGYQADLATDCLWGGG